MDYRLIPGTVAFVDEMVRVGGRAFDNDLLQNTIFPDRSVELRESKEFLEYQINRIRKRLQSPDWRYVLATIDSTVGPAKLVGYAGWMPPRTQENDVGQRQEPNATESQRKQPPAAIAFEDTPKGMDIDAGKHLNEVMEKAKKEILGKEEHRVWYLASLAVDPEFKGKGIASKLVEWGISQAEEDGLPTYLESSPAAVGLYRRQGFKELRKLSVIKKDESHFLTAMMRPSSRAEAVC